MKKTINMPEVRVISFESRDVIATSAPKLNVSNEGYQGWGDAQERTDIWD